MFSKEYQKVCEANVIYYKQTAEQYDLTETCLVDKNVQAELKRDLERIIVFLQTEGGAAIIRALDACGGSGNVALKLMKMRGIDVTLCDQSQELIDIFLKKAVQENVSCQVVRSEVAAFLAASQKSMTLLFFHRHCITLRIMKTC